MRDWEEVAQAPIGRVRRAATARVLGRRTRALIDELMSYPDVRPDWRRTTATAGSPMVPIGFDHAGTALNYFSRVSVVGMPLSILTQELRVESMFPANQDTESRHLALMAGMPAS